LLIAAGLLFAFLPDNGGAPRRWLQAGIGFLALWGLMIFLPAKLLEPAWMAQIGWTEPGWLRFPSPHLASLALLAWWGGLGWFAGVASLGWHESERLLWMKGWVTLCLGLTAFAAWEWGQGREWWAGPQVWGPFANRNQFATVLAIGTFLSVILGLRGGGRSWLWFLAAVGLGIAINLNGSRAGIVLVGLGFLVWTGMEWREGRPAAAAIVGSIALLALAAFFLRGGVLLDRVMATDPLGELRWQVQAAAWPMVASHGVLGTGVGTFEALFPIYQPDDLREVRVLHPESDLVWLTAEMGLPAVVLALALGTGLLFYRPLLRRGFGARAAAVVVMMAGAHACFDVSLHRWGVMLVVVPFAGMLVGETRTERRGKVWRILILGTLLIAGSGLWWLGPESGRASRETRIASIEAALATGAADRALQETQALLRLNPLDGRARFLEGATLLAVGEEEAAAEAFRESRRWLVYHPDYLFLEGQLWLERDPSRALDAWMTLMQFVKARRAAWESRIEQAVGEDVAVLEGWRWRNRGQSVAIESLSDSAFDRWLSQKLAQSVRDLSRSERQALVGEWVKRNPWPEVEARWKALAPEDRSALGPHLAEALLAAGRDREAWIFLPKPPLWQIEPADETQYREAMREWPRPADNLVDVVRMAARAKALGERESVGEILQTGLEKHPDARLLVAFLADLEAEQGDYAEACRLWLPSVQWDDSP